MEDETADLKTRHGPEDFFKTKGGHMNRKSAGGMLLSFTLGGLLGAGVALLLAPRSGEKTRRKILTALDDAKEGISGYAGRVKSRFV